MFPFQQVLPSPTWFHHYGRLQHMSLEADGAPDKDGSWTPDSGAFVTSIRLSTHRLHRLQPLCLGCQLASVTPTECASRSPLGVGAGYCRCTPTIPEAQASARRGRETLLDQGGDQRDLLRDAPDETTARVAFKAIMTIPQPTAFSALAKGFEGQCPCCRRVFTDADG